MNKAVAILALFYLMLNSVLAQVTSSSASLLKKWETPASLITPESVKFDPVNHCLYVANINGNPTEKDGNGFISRISLDGNILDLKWITGLNAPKGMGLFNGHLYVTDITEIAEIDISTSKILMRYPVKESVFLNDIDIDGKGIVYFSDSGNGKVFRLKNGKIDCWLQGAQFEGANGVYSKGNFLFVGTKNTIMQVDTQSSKAVVFATNTGSIDGLEAIGNDIFIYSDWSGSIYRIQKNGNRQLLLNTTSAKVNAADIEYIDSKHLLLVPTFFDNRIMAYELK